MFSLSDGEMFKGDIPSKDQKLVKSFISKYEIELLEMWNSQKFNSLLPID